MFNVPVEVSEESVQHLLDAVTVEYSPWLGSFDVNLAEKRFSEVTYNAEEDEGGDFKSKTTLNREDLLRGLKDMAVECPHRFANVLMANTDAIDADCFLQCVVYGKLVWA